MVLIVKKPIPYRMDHYNYSSTWGISSPTSIEDLGDFGLFFFYFCLFLMVCITLFCIINLWKRKFAIKTKIVWTILLLIPFIGILTYGYCVSDIEKREE